VILPAIGIALAAAVLHALWNVLLKTSGDPLLTSARAAAASATLLTPIAGVAWLLDGRPGISATVWGLVALSSLGELAYFLCLSDAYRRGDLSVVYPIARGTAPLLAIPAGLLLGERLQPIAWLGVASLLAGIWIVRRPAGSSAAVFPALLTGVCIAAYSAVDRSGARLAPPWLYGWAIWAGTAVLLNLWIWLRRGATQSQDRGCTS
jgi:drug/metabolite transporter (DMT)-like permease